MSILTNWKKHFALIFFILICPILLIGCECSFDFNLDSKHQTISPLYLFADIKNHKLQWQDSSETDMYEVFVNGKTYETFTIPDDVKDGIIEYDYSKVTTNNIEYSFEIVGKNIDKLGYHDSEKSNKIIIDNTFAKNTSSSSNYLFDFNKEITVNLNHNKINNTITFSWNNVKTSGTYLFRAFTNSIGYIEKEILATSKDSSLSINIGNIGVHDVVAYNVSYITSDTTATIISSKMNYYCADGNYTTVAFDGLLFDYYINSQEELNAIIYYNFLDRNQDYIITFDPEFKNSEKSMHNAVELAFNSFYETSYYFIVDEKGQKYGKVNGQQYNVQINYQNINECNTDITTSSEYLFSTVETNTQNYLDLSPKRSESYDNFISDKYFLTTIASKSEHLYTAVENKITPIIVSGSRADIIYSKAKEVLREIITDDMSDYEKVLNIFDWITYNTVYDYSGGSKPQSYNFTQDCCYYLEGVFLKGIAVCDGFSKAFSLLCNMEGIDCVRIVGDAVTNTGAGGHAWNKVLIDGNYYVVDITWTEITQSKFEILSHKYFLLSENTIKETHFPYENRSKFFEYPTELIPDINYYEKDNLSYKNQQDIFFNDSSTNEEICITQYIDSSTDLMNAMYLPILENKTYIELALDKTYLQSLYEKHKDKATGKTEANLLISAFQQELRAVKFPPQLISQFYDETVSGYSTQLNFITFAEDKIAIVCVLGSSLLVNEPNEENENEFYTILKNFGKYAILNEDVLYRTTDEGSTGYQIEVGVDIAYLLKELNLPANTIVNKTNFEVLMNQFFTKLTTKYNILCDFEYLFSHFETTLINNNTTRTNIGYIKLRIKTPWVEKLATPEVEITNNSIITWDKIENATSYEIYANSQLIASINAEQGLDKYSFDLSQVLSTPDSYTLIVKAKSSNINHGDSLSSNSINYIIPELPNINKNKNTISWDWKNEVTKYIIKNNNELVATITKVSKNNYNFINEITDDTEKINSLVINLEELILTEGNNSFKIYPVVNYENQNDVVGSASEEIILYKLTAPTCEFSETSLKWKASSNASNYVLSYYTISTKQDILLNSSSIITSNNYLYYDMKELNLEGNFYNVSLYAINSANNYVKSDNSNILHYTKLNSPIINFLDAQNTAKLSWTGIVDANLYEVYINNNKLTETSLTYIELDQYITAVGDFSVHVIALKTNNTSQTSAFEDSDKSESLTYTQLKSPALSISDRVILWESIEKADVYEIYIDSKFYARTESCSYKLSHLNEANIYNICVKAVSHTGGVKTSSFSNSTTLTLSKLTKPQLTLSGKSIVWTKVPNAVNYEIYSNNSLVDIVSGTSTAYNFTSSVYGTYNLHIIATSDPNTTYLDSDKSNIVTIEFEPNFLANVNITDINFTNEIISWGEVTHADSYEIYLDNEFIYNTAELFFDLTDFINDYNAHEFYILACDSTNEYDKNPSHTTYRYARTSTDFISINNLDIYKNPVLAPNVELTNSVITWEKSIYIDSYIILAYVDTNNYYIVELEKTTNSFDFSTLYSQNSINNNEIIAYYPMAEINDKLVVMNYETNYYNPYSGTYNDVYVFDGEICDYNITTQEELNNLIYFAFHKRLPSITFKTSSTIYSSYSSYLTTARDSFVETRNAIDMSYTKYSNYVITQELNFIGSYTIDQNYYNNLSSTQKSMIFNQQDTELAYFQLYPYNSDNKRDENFNDFVTDKNLVRVNVETSEELYFAVENGYSPICKSGSIAETIYLEAKRVLNIFISTTMSEYEKALTIFDFISTYTSYDYYSVSIDSDTPMTAPCYYLEGVFNYGVAVCDGFSKAYSLLCNMEGVECIRIVGDAVTSSGSGGHAWNKVKVNNSYYIVDITWTDKILEENYTNYEVLTHEYFLVSDNYVAKTHFPHANRTKYFNYPAPNNATYYDNFVFFVDDANSESPKTQDLTISSDLELENIVTVANKYYLICVEIFIDDSYWDLISSDTSDIYSVSKKISLMKKLQTLLQGTNIKSYGLVCWTDATSYSSKGYIVTLSFSY